MDIIAEAAANNEVCKKLEGLDKKVSDVFVNESEDFATLYQKVSNCLLSYENGIRKLALSAVRAEAKSKIKNASNTIIFERVIEICNVLENENDCFISDVK